MDDGHQCSREPASTYTVLASLAEGATTTEILADFPALGEGDLRAAIAFTANSAQEDRPVQALPV